MRLRLDDLALMIATRSIRRGGRAIRAAGWLGWHLGEAAGPTSRVASLQSGSRMVVDIRDYAHRHILLHGEYESQLTALFGRLARPGWTVLDVGANAGYFSLLARDLGGPRSRVVAFEPQKRVASMLRRTVDLNGARNLELVEAACGDQDGRVALATPSDPRNTGLATLRAGQVPGTTTATVPILRIDRFCAERRLAPDLMKIDVEGTEDAVLRGSAGLLTDGLPRYVVCEVWPQTREAVIDFMASHGYRSWGIGADGSLRPLSEPTAGWTNVCFVRADA
jgi:FkbM family methyltransferase